MRYMIKSNNSFKFDHMKSKLAFLVSLVLASFLFSCENMVQDITSSDLDAIAQDEIISLKSGEITDEDSQMPIFGSDKPDFRHRMMHGRFNSDCDKRKLKW